MVDRIFGFFEKIERADQPLEFSAKVDFIKTKKAMNFMAFLKCLFDGLTFYDGEPH